MPRTASTGSLLTISELVDRRAENRRPLHPSFLREPAVPSQGGHSPPAERSAGAAPLRPAPGSEAHNLKRSLGPRRANVSFRTESRQPRTFSGALRAAKKKTHTKKREWILACVGVCGRGMRKDPRRSALARNPAPPRASGGLRMESESAPSQGHHPPAASAPSYVPARVPP